MGRKVSVPFSNNRDQNKGLDETWKALLTCWHAYVSPLADKASFADKASPCLLHSDISSTCRGGVRTLVENTTDPRSNNTKAEGKPEREDTDYQLLLDLG